MYDFNGLYVLMLEYLMIVGITIFGLQLTLAFIQVMWEISANAYYHA